MGRGFYFGSNQKRLQTSGDCAVLCPPPVTSECLPTVLYDLLPHGLMENIIPHADKAEEIRLRADKYSSITVCGQNIILDLMFTSADLHELLTKMCKGSLYSYADDISNGFITLEGGVRVGVSGRATVENGQVVGVSDVRSLSIRIPHRMQIDCDELCRIIANGRGEGMLIYSPPGEGKTTLLRAIARCLSGIKYGLRVALIDTRAELEYDLSEKELLLDILSGYPINVGMEIAARTMNAQLIICDEIGSLKEAASVIAAHGCGVPLIASAHGRDLDDLLRRPGIRAMHNAGVFSRYVRIFRDRKGGFTYSISEGKDRDGL